MNTTSAFAGRVNVLGDLRHIWLPKLQEDEDEWRELAGSGRMLVVVDQVGEEGRPVAQSELIPAASDTLRHQVNEMVAQLSKIAAVTDCDDFPRCRDPT